MFSLGPENSDAVACVRQNPIEGIADGIRSGSMSERESNLKQVNHELARGETARYAHWGGTRKQRTRTMRTGVQVMVLRRRELTYPCSEHHKILA